MKYLKRTLLGIVMVALMAGHLNAQYVTTHAKTATPGQQKGVYYALPRTVIQLDFMVDKTELIEGPFSGYAYMVGANDVIIDNEVEYILRDVVMSTYAEADPNATFFVAINAKKGESQPFYLNARGILEGVGMTHEFKEVQTASPLKVQVSTDNGTFKYQYGPNGLRSEDQQARSAADMINRIREEKIKLLTGFQETAFSLETYRQMYADLDQMESDYLSLFVGKRLVNTVVKTVYVTPSKEVPTQTIAKFSTDSGFSTGTAGSGDVITLQAISLKTTGSINEPSQSAVETISHENKLFYRIPETANVKLSLGGKVLLEQRATVAQYGVFMLAPLGKAKLSLDPNTGQITGMTAE